MIMVISALQGAEQFGVQRGGQQALGRRTESGGGPGGICVRCRPTRRSLTATARPTICQACRSRWSDCAQQTAAWST